MGATPFTLQRHVRVPMRDGITLSANVFVPRATPRAPVILAMTPYGKDRMPDWLGMTLMRLSRVRFGRLDCSSWTAFEAADPDFWTRAGYAVVLVDVRGMHASQGHAGVLSDVDARDYGETIAWAAHQPWSTGAIGLLGVSYLAMSQWRVAALRPPALRAIVPWEGATDLLRELAYQDGVVETGFMSVWWRFRMQKGRNRRFAMAEDFLAERDRHPLDDDYWRAKRPDLAAIDVPALVCAGWGDHGLHTRGSLEGFERIGSREKWLFTHGRRKWETFYSAEAKALQRRFFDRYLKGERNGWERQPTVRLETRVTAERYTTRALPSWPPPDVDYRPLRLHAARRALTAAPPPQASSLRYRSDGGRARFSMRFDATTELTGGMTLKLWVATSDGDDLDLFAVVRKLGRDGREVCFAGYNGYARDGVAKGWLRASHRALDAQLSRPGRPWHTHRVVEPVTPGQIVPVELEILPSSTRFDAGEQLALDISGVDAAPYPAFRHRRSVNRGYHILYCGADFDAQLLIPVVRT